MHFKLLLLISLIFISYQSHASTGAVVVILSVSDDTVDISQYDKFKKESDKINELINYKLKEQKTSLKEINLKDNSYISKYIIETLGDWKLNIKYNFIFNDDVSEKTCRESGPRMIDLRYFSNFDNAYRFVDVNHGCLLMDKDLIGQKSFIFNNLDL